MAEASVEMVQLHLKLVWEIPSVEEVEVLLGHRKLPLRGQHSHFLVEL